MLPFLLFLSALAQKLNLDLIACNEGGGAAEGGGCQDPPSGVRILERCLELHSMRQKVEPSMKFNQQSAASFYYFLLSFGFSFCF